jgi:hypothetical protein
MEVYRNPYFILPVFLFTANQVLEKGFDLFLPYIHSYMDDLLAMPVILGITLQIYRFIHPLKKIFKFKKEHIFVAFLYVSILFEGLLPYFSKQYIRDLFDIICYGVGSLIFYFRINR